MAHAAFLSDCPKRRASAALHNWKVTHHNPTWTKLRVVCLTCWSTSQCTGVQLERYQRRVDEYFASLEQLRIRGT
jgi:hypothetical protein